MVALFFVILIELLVRLVGVFKKYNERATLQILKVKEELRSLNKMALPSSPTPLRLAVLWVHRGV